MVHDLLIYQNQIKFIYKNLKYYHVMDIYILVLMMQNHYGKIHGLQVINLAALMYK